MVILYSSEGFFMLQEGFNAAKLPETLKLLNR